MGRQSGDFNWLLILSVLALVSFSLAIIASTSPGLLGQQILFFIIGIIFFIVTFTIDAQLLISFWPLVYIFINIFLLMSFLGPNVRGSTRWLEIWNLRIQPSEIVKPLLIFVQAAYLSTMPKIRLFHVVIFIALFLLPAFIIFRQPDLGNSLIYSLTSLGLIFISQIPFKYVFLIVATVGLIAPNGWFMLRDYQRQRLFSFFNPHLDTAGASYNSLQAMIAIGSGGLFGRGLGQGPQSHLRFLPEHHTDFVFASLSEELGFFGASLLIATYFFFLLQIFLIYRRSETHFSQYLALGFFMKFLFQVGINIGMNLGLLPITGITLPFVSYGGSSILGNFIALGLLARTASFNSSRQRAIAIG